MKKIKFGIPLITLIALLAQGCAHTVEKKLDQKEALVSSEETNTDVLKEGAGAVENTPGLTPEQRVEIRSLWDKTHIQIATIGQESLKLRMVMIKDIVSPVPKAAEVNLVKKKIAGLEHEKISVYFSAIRQTNRILGRWGSENERIRFYHLNDLSEHI